MNFRHALPLCVVASLIVLSGCGKGSEDEKLLGNKQLTLPTDNRQLASANDSSPAGSSDQLNQESTISAVIGASEIPYPVYPNGSKYRVGGENGLKIVVFQTEDSFDKVDRYYKSVAGDSGMPRLIAMNDYVRYSGSSEDKDPWATYRPGIVIHQFNDDGERMAVGAKDSARTNIIMSY